MKMHKLTKDFVKIEDKCIKRQNECSKIQQIEERHTEKWRLSPLKCRNDSKKLKDFKNVALITNSNSKRVRQRERWR